MNPPICLLHAIRTGELALSQECALQKLKPSIGHLRTDDLDKLL